VRPLYPRARGDDESLLAMNALAHITTQQLGQQLLIGLINGAFYALLSLGLAVIFGMLSIVNFAHGAFFMVGAFCAVFMLKVLGLGYWWALVFAPLAVGLLGAVTERLFIRHIAGLDVLYGLLLTFGLALVMQGVFQSQFGSSAMSYPVPPALQGPLNLGFMILPIYRVWVVAFSAVVCLLVWLAIERTKIGALLRAATENPSLVRAFGVDVPSMITLTYAFGVALAALAGVLAAPILGVQPQMGANIIAVVFAVVVVGGMGSILGSVITGFTLGLLEGLTKVFYPEASNIVVFVIMAVVLLVRPAGLFGRAA